MRYCLGVDAGNTKTQALIASENGQALKMSDLSIEQIGAAGMGLAGYDWPGQRGMIFGAIQPLGLKNLQRTGINGLRRDPPAWPGK
jgi:hypothetical protein